MNNALLWTARVTLCVTEGWGGNVHVPLLFAGTASVLCMYVYFLQNAMQQYTHPKAHPSSPIPTLTGVTIILLIRSLQKNSSYLFSPHETLYVASAVKKPSSINNIGLSI